MSWDFLPPEKPKRPYKRLSDDQKDYIRSEFCRARWGQKGALARRLARELGCSRQWVIKVSLT